MCADKRASEMMRGRHAKTENASEPTVQRLVERMKKLECFYAIADLVEDPRMRFDEMLQGIAESLPPAFQYPDVTAAGLLLDGRVFQTAPLERLSPRISSSIKVHGVERGRLDVFYLAELPGREKDQFPAEERRLLDAVAERVGRIVERHEAEQTLEAQQQAVRESEEKFRTIFNSAGDAIFVTSQDGHILDANQAAVYRYGYTHGELLRMQRSDFRADGFPILEPQGLVQDGNLETPAETMHKRKDGSEFPVERLRRLIEYDGHPAILTVIRDITARKKAEEELAQSREEYRSIANLSGDIILKTDAAGRITFINDGACEFYGQPEPELLGTAFRVLRHPEDDERTEEVIEGFRRGNCGVKGYTNRHMSSQGWRTVQWNAVPLFDEHGEYEGFQATGRDITDQMEIEEELRVLNAELEGFAHTVSHDLRGPLAAILLASEAFKDFALSPQESGAQEQMLKMADVIRRNVDRSKSLIADLITLARADRFNEETELMDIGQVVKSVLEERASEIADRGIQVDVDVDLGRVVASSTHMYQLFSNLIGNALKYSNGVQGPRIQLTHTGPDEAGHHYVLRDNGPGIPDEVQSRIFEPFVKGDEGGTGIGLAIVAKIVNAYGGTIRVSNDSGAVFTFNLCDAPT